MSFLSHLVFALLSSYKLIKIIKSCSTYVLAVFDLRFDLRFLAAGNFITQNFEGSPLNI